MPMIYLSGFIFPIENMPDVDSAGHLPDSAALLPGDRARHLPQGSRPRTLWPQAVALLAWGTVVLTLATLRSSKRLG
jgi:ABC-2 type transport system permease protein